MAGRSSHYLDDSQQCESLLLNGNFWFRMEQIIVTFPLITYMEIWINELIFKIHLCSSFGDKNMKLQRQMMNL